MFSIHVSLNISSPCPLQSTFDIPQPVSEHLLWMTTRLQIREPPKEKPMASWFPTNLYIITIVNRPTNIAAGWQTCCLECSMHSSGNNVLAPTGGGVRETPPPYFKSWSSRYRYSNVKLSCFRRVQLSKSKNQYDPYTHTVQTGQVNKVTYLWRHTGTGSPGQRAV